VYFAYRLLLFRSVQRDAKRRVTTLRAVSLSARRHDGAWGRYALRLQDRHRHLRSANTVDTLHSVASTSIGRAHWVFESASSLSSWCACNRGFTATAAFDSTTPWRYHSATPLRADRKACAGGPRQSNYVTCTRGAVGSSCGRFGWHQAATVARPLCGRLRGYGTFPTTFQGCAAAARRLAFPAAPPRVMIPWKCCMPMVLTHTKHTLLSQLKLHNTAPEYVPRRLTCLPWIAAPPSHALRLCTSRHQRALLRVGTEVLSAEVDCIP
jgi:hypothetical protein